MAKNPKRPRDPMQLAKLIGDIAIGEALELPIDQNKNEGKRRGGLKGGKARAEKLSPEKRKEIAQKAAKTRWSNKD